MLALCVCGKDFKVLKKDSNGISFCCDFRSFVLKSNIMDMSPT